MVAFGLIGKSLAAQVVVDKYQDEEDQQTTVVVKERGAADEDVLDKLDIDNYTVGQEVRITPAMLKKIQKQEVARRNHRLKTETKELIKPRKKKIVKIIKRQRRPEAKARLTNFSKKNIVKRKQKKKAEAIPSINNDIPLLDVESPKVSDAVATELTVADLADENKSGSASVKVRKARKSYKKKSRYKKRRSKRGISWWQRQKLKWKSRKRQSRKSRAACFNF